MLNIQTATVVVNSTAELAAAIGNLATIVAASLLSVVGAASTIARFMPPPDGPGLLSTLHRIINWIGQNSGYAANAPKDGK